AADAYQNAVNRGLLRDDEDRARDTLTELAEEWMEATDRIIAVLRDDTREFWVDPDGAIAAALKAIMPVEPHEWRRVGTHVGTWVNTVPGRTWPAIPVSDPTPTPTQPRLMVTTDHREWVIARLEDRSLALF